MHSLYLERMLSLQRMRMGLRVAQVADAPMRLRMRSMGPGGKAREEARLPLPDEAREEAADEASPLPPRRLLTPSSRS